MTKRTKRQGPPDTNELAFRVVQQMTGEAEPCEPEESAKARAGRLGGLKGGKARAESLTAEERSAIAKKAADSRWGETVEKRPHE